MMSSTTRDLAEGIAALARARGHTVVAAESVTAGHIASSLASATDASEWLLGSIVAYHGRMKRSVLRVGAELFVTPECARQMASGALDATGADLVVAVTGVGGPDPEEGQPPGTVFICAGSRRGLVDFAHKLDGNPEEIVEQATLHGLRHLKGAALNLK